MELVLPLLVFGGFMAYFALRARREGVSTRDWIDNRNALTFGRQGWWHGPAIVAALFVAAPLVAASIDQGFRWRYVLFALGAAALIAFWMAYLSWWARRYRERH